MSKEKLHERYGMLVTYVEFTSTVVWVFTESGCESGPDFEVRHSIDANNPTEVRAQCEQHYLMSCSNTMFMTLRNNFKESLYKTNKSLMLFNTQDLFHYVISKKDKNILKIRSKFCYDILTASDILQ